MSKPKIKFELFAPEKVKITDNVVEISYYNLEDTNTIENPKSDNRPHPKLIGALYDLREIMAKALSNLDGWEFAREAARKDVAPGGMLEQAVAGYKKRVDDHNVTGLYFITGEHKGIQITGSVKSELSSTGLAAPKIYFDKVVYGPQAEELAEKVRERMYAFLFQGEWIAPEEKKKKAKEKKTEDPAQTSILDANQQTEK